MMERGAQDDRGLHRPSGRRAASARAVVSPAASQAARGLDAGVDRACIANLSRFPMPYIEFILCT